MGRRAAPPKGLAERTIGEAADAFIDHVRTRLPNSGTPLAKSVVIRTMVQFLGPARPVWTVTTGDFDDVLSSIINGADEVEAAQRRAEGRKARTGRTTAGSIASAATALRQFAEFCRRHKWLDGGTTLERAIVRSNKRDTRAPETPPARIAAEDFPAVLTLAETIHPRLRMAVAMGLFCGRRVSESVRLQWRHLDWDNEVIQFFNVKGGRWITHPLHPAIRAEIERWRAWAEAETSAPVQPHWYLVPSRVDRLAGTNARARLQSSHYPVDFAKSASTDTVQKDTLKLLGLLGIYGKGEGTHTFRRSAAVWIEEQFGPEAAQRFLDHKSPVTTQLYTGNRSAAKTLHENLMHGTTFPQPRPLATVHQLRAS